MYGHEMVSRDLKRRMEARLPHVLRYLRWKRNATLEALPNPAMVLPYYMPDTDVDAYPTVCVTELDTPTGLTGSRGIDQGMEYDLYTYRYPIRVFIHVRGTDYGDTELQLKRYLTAVRMVILENVILTNNDEASVTMDPVTITEAFDTAFEDAARQVLSTGWVGVVLESTEPINAVVIPGDPGAEEFNFTINAAVGALDDDGTSAGTEPVPGGPIRTS